MRSLGSLFIAIFISAGLSAVAQTTPGYQQGTIQPGDHGFQIVGQGRQVGIGTCGKFQSGQSVEFRVDRNKVFVRADGKEYTCFLIERTTSSQPSSQTAAPPALGYESGEILGYAVRRDTVEKNTRAAKVYELRGANLLYLIDYCGSFQAGRFSPGQQIQFRVDADDDRLYVQHDGDKEYGCQLEGMRLLSSAEPAISAVGNW